MQSPHLTYRRSYVLHKVVSSAEASATKFMMVVNSGSLPAANSGVVNDSFKFVGQIKTSAGVDTPGFSWKYYPTSGVIWCANEGSATLAQNMEATIIGTYFDV